MLRLVATFLVLVTTVPAAGQAIPANFEWFKSLVGSCWVGQFPDGKTSHRQCYTAQFNRFIRGTATLFTQRDAQPNVTFEGDSHFAWNDSKQAIDYYIWGSDGSYRQLEARYEGDELVFPAPSRADPSKVEIRSVWRQLDANTFEVRRERSVGLGWKGELTVTYRRQGADR